MVVTELAPCPERERFADDGNRDALQLCVQKRSDASSAERYQFEHGFAVVGSASLCQLRLDDPAVPARALYIQQLKNRVVAVLLEECRADTPLAKPSRAVRNLAAGVPFSVGPFELWQSAVVPSDWDGPPHVGEQPLAAFAEPIAVWEIANVKGGTDAPRTRYLRHALTLIGRGPACRFRMVHDSISEIHASLVYVHGELQVVDLCSEHGVFVNGQRVCHAALKDGDELRIGQCHGVIRWLGQLQQSSVPETVPVELSPCQLIESAPPDGIVVSLSDSGLDVQDVTEDLHEEYSHEIPTYSEEHCLTLVSQFLEMQQSVLAQTQMLMQKISDRLATESVPTSAGATILPEPERLDAIKPTGEASPSSSDEMPPPRRRRIRPQRSGGGEPNPAPPPEFHVWLTRQLSDLESSQRSGFSRLWECLTGLK